MARFHSCVPLVPTWANASEVGGASSSSASSGGSGGSTSLQLREAAETWEREGWAVLPKAVASELADAAAAFVAAELPDEPSDGQYGDNKRAMDAWQRSPAARAIAEHPAVLEFIQALTGRRPRPFQTLSFRYGTQQAAHSDLIHFSTLPQGLVVGAWTALEDVHPAAGPLVIYPGSHRHRVRYFEDLHVRIQPGVRGYGPHKAYLQYEAALKAKVLSQIEPRPMLLQKGDVVLWAANLLHGGEAIAERNRTRMSQVTHYFLDGARFYWSPRLSNLTSGQIHSWSRFSTTRWWSPVHWRGWLGWLRGSPWL